MNAFHTPCRGKTMALATLRPKLTLSGWMRVYTRLMELGVQVTKTDMAKTKLVRRYASLTGSKCLSFARNCFQVVFQSWQSEVCGVDGLVLAEQTVSNCDC